MAIAASTTAQIAVYLGIYASIVATATGLWALYSGIFRDRARISVKAFEVFVVVTMRRTSTTMEPHLSTTLRADRAPQAVDKPPPDEALEILIRNRGRRPAKIMDLAQVNGLQRNKFVDAITQLPIELDAEDSKTIFLGQGDYSHGDIKTRRFYVVDGAGRIHPLLERYRQRAENVLYRRLILHFRRWRRRTRHAESL